MTIRKIITFGFILNLLTWNLLAQTGCICPKIEVTGPSSLLRAGETAVFTVKVAGDTGQSTYNWTVSGGEISGGQGTSVIEVYTKGLEGQKVTATVIVGGWCPECRDLTMSKTAEIYMPPPKPEARLVDILENAFLCEERQAIMHNYFIELNNDPGATGYIFTFGSTRLVAKVESQMRAYIKLANSSAVDRIVFVNGGGRSKRPVIQFWNAPQGAEKPAPEPPVEAEADFDTGPEIVIDPKGPYVFSSVNYDRTCFGEENQLNLDGYAKKLKENPKSRGKIVILMMSKTEFRQEEKEILNYLAKKGIARKRLKTFHNKTSEGVELWFLP